MCRDNTIDDNNKMQETSRGDSTTMTATTTVISFESSDNSDVTVNGVGCKDGVGYVVNHEHKNNSHKSTSKGVVLIKAIKNGWFSSLKRTHIKRSSSNKVLTDSRISKSAWDINNISSSTSSTTICSSSHTTTYYSKKVRIHIFF